MAILLERQPYPSGTAVTKSREEWGLMPGLIQSMPWQVGQLTLVSRGASPVLSAPIFNYRDKIIVWENGVRVWQGWVIDVTQDLQPEQAVTYRVADPGWWLTWDDFVWPFTPEPPEVSTLLGGAWLGYSLAQRCATAPIAYDADDLAAFTAPCPDLRASGNHLSLIQRVARLHPLAVQWWDFDAEVPVFRCCLRSGLAAVSVARGHCQEPISMTPLHTKQLTGVSIEYQFVSGSGVLSSTNDVAGPGPYDGPNSLNCKIRVGSDDAADAAANAVLASQAQSYFVATLLYGSFAALPWAGTLTMVDTPSQPLPAIRPGQALNITGGRTEWATMAAQVQATVRTLGENRERLTVQLGCGEHLGPMDYLAMAGAAGVSGGAGGGNSSPYDPPGPPDPPTPGGTPGTLADLNGGGDPAGTPDGSIKVERISISGDLRGWAENTGYASTPPKFYLSLGLSGTWDDHMVGFEYGWVPFDGYWRMIWSGTNTAHPGTGDLTIAAQCASYAPVGGAGQPSTANTNELNCPLSNWEYPGVFDILSATQRSVAIYPRETRNRTWTITNEFGSMDHTTSGDGIETLGNEQTEQNLIDLYVAGSLWGNYGPTATAAYPARTTGRTVSFGKLRWRLTRTVDVTEQQWVPDATNEHGVFIPGHYITVVISSTELQEIAGLRNWWWYTLKVIIERRPTGGTWADFETREFLLQTDLTGVAATPDWNEVIPDRRYEYRIKSWAIEP